MEKIKFKDSWGKEDEFEVVEEFPEGYVVWNIGRHNFPVESYVPIARDLGHFNVDNPKCIKVKDEKTAQKIMHEAAWGKGFVDKKKFLRLI